MPRRSAVGARLRHVRRLLSIGCVLAVVLGPAGRALAAPASTAQAFTCLGKVAATDLQAHALIVRVAHGSLGSARRRRRRCDGLRAHSSQYLRDARPRRRRGNDRPDHRRRSHAHRGARRPHERRRSRARGGLVVVRHVAPVGQLRWFAWVDAALGTVTVTVSTRPAPYRRRSAASSRCRPPPQASFPPSKAVRSRRSPPARCRQAIGSWLPARSIAPIPARPSSTPVMPSSGGRPSERRDAEERSSTPDHRRAGRQ